MDKCIEDKNFCKRWAELTSKEYDFSIRYDANWKKPWRIEFYDLHRWAGERCHWNCHDVGSGEGYTIAEAWKDMAIEILKCECVASKEEALVKAELASQKDLPRGWGQTEYAFYYKARK